jgi:hypothetical protein
MVRSEVYQCTLDVRCAILWNEINEPSNPSDVAAILDAGRSRTKGFQAKGWDSDHASITNEKPNEEKVTEASSSTNRGNNNNDDDVVGVDQRVLLLRSEMQETKARRPIVSSNLLQNEMQETKARRPIVSNLLY